MKTKLRKFKSLRELFRTPSRWCKGSLARSSTGEEVQPRGTKAAKFCLVGAVYRVYPPTKRWRVEEELSHSIGKVTGRARDIVEFNDDMETTFEDIRKVLKEAKV